MKSQLVLLAVVLWCGTVLGGVLTWEGEAPAEPVEQARQEPRPPKTEDDVEPVWHTDWQEAQRVAHQANKPIFAVMVCKH